MLGTGQDFRIVLRQSVLTLIACQLLGAELRLRCLHPLDPLIRNPYRNQIRIREVTVILRILLGTHRMGGFLVVIPAAGFLDDLFAILDQLDLTDALALNGTGNGFEGV